MGMDYSGKTVLILGSNAGSTDLVTYARHNGAHVVVADYLSPEKSPAKLLADESLLISTADVDALSAFVVDNHVDAVFSGISEFNILKAMEIAERTGLKFYCNHEQWNQIEIKDNFCALCAQNGVPTPEAYYIGGDLEEAVASPSSYPVVVKPVDSSGSFGVHICKSAEELQSKAPLSIKESGSHRIMVQRFFTGKEFTAHYVIDNGKATLVCIDNRYPVAVHSGAVTTVPAARIYPSLFHEAYMNKVDAPMRRLCESIGLKNAVMFIQGFYNETSGEFAVFEGGMRSAAELPNRLIRKALGKDYMAFLLDSFVFDDAHYDAKDDDYLMNGLACGCVSFVGKGGSVKRITGREQIRKNLPSVVQIDTWHNEGDVIPSGDSLRQLTLRFYLCCDSREAMANDVRYINEVSDVLDENGNSLILKFDPSRLSGLD